MSKLLEYIQPVLKDPVFSYTALASCLSGSSDRKHALVKRALHAKDIIQLRRGLYCVSERHQKRCSLFDVAQYIYGPSYVSFESALEYHGWIPEAVYTLTCASQGKSKVFDTPLGRVMYRRIPAEVFYEGVERNAEGVFVATPFRAILDILYARRKAWKSAGDVTADMRVENDLLRALGRDEIMSYKTVYRSRRVHLFLKALLAEGGHEH